MGELFLKLLNMSITASYLVLAVVFFRLIFKKTPKFIHCFMWALVGVRLIFPFSLESVLSLIPSAAPLPNDIITGPDFNVNTGINFVDSRVNDYLDDRYFEGVTVPTNNGADVMSTLSLIWLIGMSLMLAYTVISYMRIHFRVREAAREEGNIWVCDRIDTPFILGIIKPRIFLPSAMNGADTRYVTAHEKAHIKRRDHIWKPLGFLFLTVHWFNPFMWLAYILLCRDIELACDEKVIKEMGSDIKKAYSEALINCSVPRKMIAACPLAFGETSVKSRIKTVLNYKKPAFWVIIIASLTSIAVAVCFLTDPIREYIIDPQNNGAQVVGLAGIRYGTQHADIEFICTDMRLTGDNPYIEAKWVNNSDDFLCYGEEFYLYRNNEKLQIKEGYAWNMPLYMIKSGGSATVNCSLSYYNISESGLYRLEKEFYLDSDPDTEYIAYIEFQIGLNVLTQYAGEQIIFEDGMYSSIIYTNENIPQYAVSGEGHLLTNEWPDSTFSGSMYDIGKLEKIELTKQNFDELLGNQQWRLGSSARGLRSDNKNAYKAVDSHNNRFYYLLEQENGDIYITYGYSDRNTIRWIFKMKSVAVSADDLMGNTNISGTVCYYTKPILETETPTVGSYAVFDEAEMKLLREKLSEQKWVNDALVDRLKHKYDGQIYHDDWIYFGYEQKVVYYDGHFCTASDEIFDMIKRKQVTAVQLSNHNPYFNATVVEVYENSVLVEPFAGEEERRTADKISISTDVISTQYVPEMKKGTEIRVVYNGTIMETYPAQITDVFAIYLLSDVE